MKDDVVLDPDKLRAELAITTDDALALADRLALHVVDSPRNPPPIYIIARGFQEKRILMRRLRRALRVETGG